MNGQQRQPLKVLLICAAAPYGEVNGMGQRTRMVAHRLSELAELTMVAVSSNWTAREIDDTSRHFNLKRVIRPHSVRRKKGERILGLLNPNTLKTHDLDISPDDKSFLSEQLKEHHLVWVHTIKIANVAGIKACPNGIIDADDFPSRYCTATIKAQKNLFQKARFLGLYLCWKAKEQRLRRRFGSIVVCKRSDRSAFNCPERTFVVPNSIQISESIPPALPDSPVRFGLIGNFGYELNTDAVDWFLKHCWDRVRHAIPHAQLRLVGKGSERYQNPGLGIAGLGFIDEPGLELASWSALVAPIRYGGGTSVKVAEALARQIPVVTTQHGARGYSDLPECPIMIHDDADSFANACIAIGTDPSLQSLKAEQSKAFFDAHLTYQRAQIGIDQAFQRTSQAINPLAD